MAFEAFSLKILGGCHRKLIIWNLFTLEIEGAMFVCCLQDPAALELLAATVACSRSSTEADDTIAAAELDPDVLGVRLLPVTTKINCMVTVEDERVRN